MIETVKATRILRPRIEQKSTFEGGIEIWARLDEGPEFDALLVTVHYNYGFMDNIRKREVAAAIVELLGGSDRDN